jgi:hypothetical protein
LTHPPTESNLSLDYTAPIEGAFFILKKILFKNMNTKVNNKNLLRLFILIGALAILGYFGFTLLNDDTSANNSTTERIKVSDAIATTQIDRDFSFPIKNDAGEDLSQFKIVLDKAELRDQIIVQGKRATSVEGRTFLIVDIEIKNEYNRAVEIDTRDFFRLTMNGNEEMMLAPDIHNDPVEVQAISTKLTRIGFPVNDTDKSFVLHIGEINGNKERIDLNLLYK